MGGLPTNRTVNGFTVHPENSRVMYVATRDGLFQSGDGGVTWKALGNGLKNLAAVTLNLRKPNEVYVSTADGVIFKSTDSGTTWEPQR